MSRVAEDVHRDQERLRELHEAERKLTRDKQSDPAIVRRNMAIIRRREQDPTQSYGLLALDFKVSEKQVKKIIDATSTWKLKAARLTSPD